MGVPSHGVDLESNLIPVDHCHKLCGTTAPTSTSCRQDTIAEPRVCGWLEGYVNLLVAFLAITKPLGQREEGTNSTSSF